MSSIATEEKNAVKALLNLLKETEKFNLVKSNSFEDIKGNETFKEIIDSYRWILSSNGGIELPKDDLERRVQKLIEYFELAFNKTDLVTIESIEFLINNSDFFKKN